jgi:hypothetical protein
MMLQKCGSSGSILTQIRAAFVALLQRIFAAMGLIGTNLISLSQSECQGDPEHAF